MAEIHIEDFPEVAGLEFGDVHHIQRLGTAWKDYQVRNRFRFGMDVASKTMTYDIQDLLTVPQNFVVPPAAGTIYVPFKSYAVYTPGSITDGATFELLGRISFESGGNNGACCRFVLNGNVQAAPLRSSGPDILSTATGAFHFAGIDPTTSDGTIKVFSQYAIVTL